MTIRAAHRAAVAVALAIVLSGCGPRGNGAAGTADSTAAAPAAAAAADSAADSAATDSTADSMPAPPKTADTPAPTLGRDSAFGPKYLVDSTGKLIPIGERKKP